MLAVGEEGALAVKSGGSTAKVAMCGELPAAQALMGTEASVGVDCCLIARNMTRTGKMPFVRRFPLSGGHVRLCRHQSAESP